MARSSATSRARALSALLLAVLAALAAPPAQGGSADAPEVTDPPGDAGLPPLDLVSAWFEADATTLRVHIVRGSEAGTVPAGILCLNHNCTGSGISLEVVFSVLKADGTPAPAAEDYTSTYVVVRLGPENHRVSAGVGTYDGQGNATPVEPVPVQLNGTELRVDVPLSSAAIGLSNGTTGARVSIPYASSYAMACTPAEECLSQGAPAEQAASLWDRAPDEGVGADFAFPPTPAGSPAPGGGSNANGSSTDAPAAHSTETVTHTETQSVTETVTVTRSPQAESKASPAAGLLLVLATVGLAALRRRLL